MSNDETDRYALMGDPIEHSKSPQIHRLFAEQTGENLTYGAIRAPRKDFASMVDQFRRSGGKGLNITVPLKQDAWEMVTRCSVRAGDAGAVNTIIIGDSLFGDNTDGVGLIRDLRENYGLNLCGKRILLLGAGGAGRGVIGPLLSERPAGVVVANRTAKRAIELAAMFRASGIVHGFGLDALSGGTFDLIVNATSAGLGGETPDLPKGLLVAGGWCYDLMYADEPTAFVRWGITQGASKSLDGLGMLVEQAAESFYLWRGVRPLTRPVIEAIRT